MSGAEILYSLALFTAIAAALLCEFYSRKLSIGSVPTGIKVRKRIIALVKEYGPEKSELNIAELGCGWGGLLLALSRAFPQASIEGYEFSPLPHIITKTRLLFSKRKKTELHKKDIFKADLSKFDVIVCYLSPWHMEQLKDKLEEEMKPGSVLISNAFPVPGWTPVQSEDIQTLKIKKKIYVYKNNT